MSAQTPTSDTTVSEMLGSLTGFEEIAITKAFGQDVFTLLDVSTMTGGRALVFVDKLRGGLDHAAAKKAALTLTVKQTDAYFAEDADDADPEAPDSESGKDSSSPA